MKTLVLALAIAAAPLAVCAEVGPPPPFSEADKAQMQEDMAIIQRPVHVTGNGDAAAKAARLASCVEYWGDNIHRDRHPDARKFLLGVRIARCMFRTQYTIIHGPCKPIKVAVDNGWRAAIALAPVARCYAKFDRELPRNRPVL